MVFQKIFKVVTKPAIKRLLRPFLALFFESANHNGQLFSVKENRPVTTPIHNRPRGVEYQMETAAKEFKTKTKKNYFLAKFDTWVKTRGGESLTTNEGILNRGGTINIHICFATTENYRSSRRLYSPSITRVPFASSDCPSYVVPAEKPPPRKPPPA